MSKMTKRSEVATAAVLVLTLGGVALASIQPTLTLTASVSTKKAIVAQGTYNPVDTSKCGSAVGKTIRLYVDSLTDSGWDVLTTTSGAYSTKTGNNRPTGTHTVQTFAQGVMGGTYGTTRICEDAWSPVRSVTVP